MQAARAPQFSVAPPSLPAIGDADVAPPSDALSSLDVNGLLLTAGQVYSTQLGTSTLRALLAYPFLSDTYAPLSDRWDDVRTGQPNVDAVIR